MSKTALITGATGYIGAHTVHALHAAGFRVDAIDIDIANRNNIVRYCSSIIQCDVRDFGSPLDKHYDVVVHLAGLIQVGESMTCPTAYYDTNLFGTISALKNFNADHFIFASTAGCFDPISPYAKSKHAAEDVIKELAKKYTIFRFFNVAGSNGLFKQFGPSTHIIRVAAETAAGKREKMTLFGDDYPTVDGTCIRDYVHVVDLSNAIVRAALDTDHTNIDYHCIGSGKTYTNLQVIEMMKNVSGVDFKVDVGPRRSGDPAELRINSTSKYVKIDYTLRDMCQSAYSMELK
jgi:UDP-glucose 4-epimerase